MFSNTLPHSNFPSEIWFSAIMLYDDFLKIFIPCLSQDISPPNEEYMTASFFNHQKLHQAVFYVHCNTI